MCTCSCTRSLVLPSVCLCTHGAHPTAALGSGVTVVNSANQILVPVMHPPVGGHWEDSHTRVDNQNAQMVAVAQHGTGSAVTPHCPESSSRGWSPKPGPAQAGSSETMRTHVICPRHLGPCLHLHFPQKEGKPSPAWR